MKFVSLATCKLTHYDMIHSGLSFFFRFWVKLSELPPANKKTLKAAVLLA